MIERIALFCHRRRWSVLVTWLVVVIGVSVLAGAAGTKDADGGRLNGSDSDTAQQIVKREFPADDGSEATIVFHANDGVAAHRAQIDQFVAGAKQLQGVSGAATPFDTPTRIS
ncbi:MAG: hypothetical protein ABIR68_05215, partial [Ilumatobacteraceae bacterium]